MSNFVPKNIVLKTHHRIINADSRQMAEVADNSVHLVITSPPYWQLKDYGTDDQIAMFPEELPRRLIKIFSFVGETVLDPFAGSGTTALASKNLCRNSVGFEINPEFIPIIKEKMEVHQKDIDETTYEINDLGVPLSGWAFRSNPFFVPQKRISTSIPNAA